MYSVQCKSRGHRTEDKVSTFEKAKRLAWTSIQKPEVTMVEIWMGGLFQARISKEGHV